MKHLDRLKDLVAIYGSQRKTANALGVSQSYISRLFNNKRGKRFNSTLSKKINSRWLYRRKKWLWQIRAKVKLTTFDRPVWVSSEVTELEYLEDVKERLLKRLNNKYEAVEIIRLQTKKYKAD